ELALAAAALTDARDMLVELDREADRIDDAAAVILGERQIGDRQFAGQRQDLFRLGEQQAGIGHAGGLELLDDLLVGDPRVLLDLIEVEELLPGRGEILVSGEDRHQRAERQGAPDDEIAAQRVEEERRQLTYEVIEKLRKK